MASNLLKVVLKNTEKFDLGCDVAKEEVFTYPYLTDDDTIAYIKGHGRIMFVIRGPNSTMKADLSKMIISTYPSAVHCCADHYFIKNPRSRTRETLKLSHLYCEKRVKKACTLKESPIIVQNTHMRKFEFQKYIDLALEYNYTIIMAITLYKFNISPERLAVINPDGLDIQYFTKRLKQWQDVPPLYTAWFLSPNDSNFILTVLQLTVSALLGDGKFCSAFDFYKKDDMWQYFVARKLLYCIAGYSYDKFEMKGYYLSDLVQENYGRSYEIAIVGYLVTPSAIFGIVKASQEMLELVLEVNGDAQDFLKLELDSIHFNDNYYKDTILFNHVENGTCLKSLLTEDLQDEKMHGENCRLIHLAQKRFEDFTIHDIERNFITELRSLPEDLNFIELEDDIKMCRLADNKWIVRPTKQIKVKTIFSGLYI